MPEAAPGTGGTTPGAQSIVVTVASQSAEQMAKSVKGQFNNGEKCGSADVLVYQDCFDVFCTWAAGKDKNEVRAGIRALFSEVIYNEAERLAET